MFYIFFGVLFFSRPTLNFPGGCMTALNSIRIHTCILLIYIHTPFTLVWTLHMYCSGLKTPDCTWGRLSEALGNWGSGNLEGGGFGEGVGTGEVSLQATWDRGGPILSQLGGFQVSRKGWKGSKGRQKGNQQGEGKSKGNAPRL